MIMVEANQKMRIDMHVHIADLVSCRNAAPPTSLWSNGFLARYLRRIFFSQDCLLDNGREKETGNDEWHTHLANWVEQSQVDRVVLLALDEVYDVAGNHQPEKTRLSVSNDFVHGTKAVSENFMFGASIHPYRRDAIVALEKVVSQGACLIKWIPSAQFIEPDAPQCLPFYEAMAHHNIPLLSHTGVEHSLGVRRASLNHPDRLIPALKKGVKVIAAHCGTNLFLHEKSFFKDWAKLAHSYETCFGDLSALPVMTRVAALRKILSDKVLHNKVVYGSDFPTFPSPLWCWQLGLREMRNLSAITNPIERNYRVMKALGVPDSVFYKAYSILKI